MRQAAAERISPEEFAKRLEDSGTLLAYIKYTLDKIEQEEFLEFLGRWADDGGSMAVEDENDPALSLRMVRGGPRVPDDAD
jgi:hypothetical protein